MGGGSSTNSVPESFDRAASTKRAALVREQWDDYKTRFHPIENQIIQDMGTGTQTNFNAMGLENANKSVNTAFAGAEAMKQRDTGRFGMDRQQPMIESDKTEMGVAKTQSLAHATNTARQWDVDRRNAVMSGGLGNAATAGKA